MKEIEKNDVDISKLFRWSRKVEVNSFGKILEFYMRLCGDAEINRARVYALRKSAEFRKLLRTKDSDERLAYIPEFLSVVEEELINGILALSIKDFTTEAVFSVKLPLPKEPESDTTLEEQEKYQQNVDEYPVRREVAIRKYIEEKLEKERKLLEKLSKEKLQIRYETQAINQLCEAEMLTRFREMCTCYSLYMDENFKHKAFESFDEFSNIPSDIKNQLVELYVELDIDGEVLKKLQGVTQ